MKKFTGILITTCIISYLLPLVSYANETKSCTGEMGDVKMSLLGLSAFTELHGNCWKAMDGTNIEGEPLAQKLPHLKGKTPNALGRFFRVMDVEAKIDPDGEKRLTGEPQEDLFKSHLHKNENHVYKWNRSFRGDGGNPKTLVDRDSGSADSHGYKKTAKTGGVETRPKNISINAYVNTGNPND